jgi:leader peptidase (prepilin peptidase)/N-methyltransferase
MLDNLHLLMHPPIAMAIAGIFGLLIGSFLNVVIYRLPVMMERAWRAECAVILADGEAATPNEPPEPKESSEPEPKERFDLMFPRSRCPRCGHAITALENVPVVSYLVLGGKCSSCKTGISPRYPIVEIITGALSVLVIGYFGVTIVGVAALALTYALIALALIDADTQLLPDDITLPFLWLGLALNIYGGFVPLRDAVIGAIAGYLALWTVYQGFKLLTKREGMGFGDFKLLAMLGAWLGWEQLPVIVLLSSLVGAVVGVCLMVFAKHGREVPIPFGPYLAAAGFLAMLFGNDISTMYLDNAFPGSRY